MRQRMTTLVASAALGALATAAGAWAAFGATASVARANVIVVKEDFFVANGTVRNSVARCPAGTKVFSGGFASTGQHAKVFVAGPSRGENGFAGYAVTPPVNINAGVGKEIARITLVAYCAPAGQPIVLG
jgi:hypothetical protein